MSWSHIVKSSDTNTQLEPKKVKTRIIKKNNLHDEYSELYHMHFNEDINDLYLHLKELSSDRCLNILNETKRNTYSDFFKLIYDNTEMMQYSDSDTDTEDEYDNTL
jgi:hypothetical protein